MVLMPHKTALNSENKPMSEIPIQATVYSLLNQIGEDPEREGLLKTPDRFERAIRELTSGYQLTAREAVGDGIFAAEGNGLISVKKIEFHSLCEHHLLPFWGHISISYYPNDKILGLSKLARVVEVFARRLQVQERLTREVAEAIHDLTNARAVFVHAEAQHMCMMMRGVRKNDSLTQTEFTLGFEQLSDFERHRLSGSSKD
jgi:GTP cyclohydrolase I